MTMVDPWSMLLEQFLVEPTDDGGGENRPAARAQPEAGAAVKPKRTKKAREAMNIASRRCMVVAEIGNDGRMECYLTEVDQSTTVTEMMNGSRAGMIT